MKIPEYTSLEEKGYSLNVKTPAKTFEQYQCIVEADVFDEWYNKHELQSNLFFRGVKEAKYKNFTSAQRLYFTQDYHNVGPSELIQAQIDEMRKVHEDIFSQYCKSMGMPCTDLFLMSCSQHHKNGISPLLDFTSHLDTALFFMCYGTQSPTSGIGDSNVLDINNFVSLYSFSRKKQYSLQNICNALVESIKTEAMESSVEKEHRVKLSEELKKIKNQEHIANIFREKIIVFFSYPNLHHALYQLVDYSPILIVNEPLKIKIIDYETEAKFTISNLNIVAQHGCFLYHDKGISPLEKGLSCVDIHKSLIPYIVNKYLKPKHIDESLLFPTEDNLVNEATFNMMANIVAPSTKAE